MAPNVSRSARNNRDRVKVPGVCFRNRSRLSRPDEWGHIRAIGRTEGGGRSCMWTSGCWGGPSQCGDRGDRAPAERQKPPSRGVFTPHGPTGTQPSGPRFVSPRGAVVTIPWLPRPAGGRVPPVSASVSSSMSASPLRSLIRTPSLGAGPPAPGGPISDCLVSHVCRIRSPPQALSGKASPCPLGRGTRCSHSALCSVTPWGATVLVCSSCMRPDNWRLRCVI